MVAWNNRVFHVVVNGARPAHNDPMNDHPEEWWR